MGLEPDSGRHVGAAGNIGQAAANQGRRGIEGGRLAGFQPGGDKRQESWAMHGSVNPFRCTGATNHVIIR